VVRESVYPTTGIQQAARKFPRPYIDFPNFGRLISGIQPFHFSNFNFPNLRFPIIRVPYHCFPIVRVPYLQFLTRLHGRAGSLRRWERESLRKCELYRTAIDSNQKYSKNL
jgi:hypothetical protein